MRRRNLLLGLVALPVLGYAQSAKPRRIAYLSSLSREVSNAWFPAFREGLRELGYVEGRGVVIDERYAAGDLGRLPALAAELVPLKPDVFLTYGAEAALAADRAGKTIPVVFANIQDPVVSGVVASLARPAGNITGLSDAHAASVTKRLELLKEILGKPRVAVLWRPGNRSHELQLKDLQPAAAALGVSVFPQPLAAEGDIERTFAAMRSERVDAVLILGDALMTSHHRRIADLAVKNRMAAMYTIRPFTDAGGMIAYGADFRDLFRRAATYVDKIFKGAKPADLPVEQATKFDLVINLKAAKAIGIEVPRAVLLRADQVIQ